MRISPLVALCLLGLVPSGATLAQSEQHGRHDDAGHAGAVGIGAVHFANSGNAASQAPFQRGIALLHNFAYRQAAQAFRDAERADPTLAVAYWAEALTYSHLLWSTEDTSASHMALRRLAPTAAERLARARSARERDFGAAVEALFQDATVPVRAHAFGDSMRAFAARYPTDLEATAFGALGVIIDWYQGGLQDSASAAAQEEAIVLAERVFRTSPQHPAGAHYLIHATDDPKRAARGLAAARAYARIAPSVGHALHMPSHIFVQTGLWPDLVASNVRAWAASRANIAEERLSTAELDFHSLAWLTYGYLEQGRFRSARATVDTADAVLRGVNLPIGSPDARYARSWQSFMYAMETDDWSAYRPSRGEATPDTSTPRAVSFAITSAYQHAVAAAMLGDTASASANWLLAYAVAHPSIARRAGALNRGILHLAALSARGRGDTVTELAILTRAAAADDSAGAPIGPPSILRSHELLGAALLRAGRASDAVSAYQRALAQTPNRSAALLGLARAQAAVGNAAAAREAYGALATNWRTADVDFPALTEARQRSAAPKRP